MTPVVQVTSRSLFFMHELDHSKGHHRLSRFHWKLLPVLISLRRFDSWLTFSSCDMRVCSIKRGIFEKLKEKAERGNKNPTSSRERQNLPGQTQPIDLLFVQVCLPCQQRLWNLKRALHEHHRRTKHQQQQHQKFSSTKIRHSIICGWKEIKRMRGACEEPLTGVSRTHVRTHE